MDLEDKSMNLEKMKRDEIKGLDATQAKQTEVEIRRELAKMRLDILVDKKNLTGKRRELKRNLARVLTQKQELMRTMSK